LLSKQGIFKLYTDKMKTTAKQFIIDNYGEIWLHVEWPAGDVMDIMDDFHELRMQEIKAELSTEESTPKLTDEEISEIALCTTKSIKCDFQVIACVKPKTDCICRKDIATTFMSESSLPASDTQKDEIVLLEELLVKSNEISTFYGQMIDKNASYLWAHRIKASDEEIAKGVQLRKEFEDLKSELAKLRNK